MRKAFKVEVTAKAEADLIRIGDWICRDSPLAAQKFMEALNEKIFSLESFPKRCALIKDLPAVKRQYRHLLVGDYRIVFRIEGGTVYVVRAIHGAQLLKIP